MKANPDAAESGGVRRFARARLLWPVVATLALAIGMSVLLVRYRAPLEPLGNWGYPGVFLIMLANNLTILFPSLGYAFLAAAAQTLNPWLLGIVGGVGAALGELSGYYVGRSSGRVLVNKRLLQRYREKGGVRGNFVGPTLFIFAVTPLPFDFAGVLAGAVHYPLLKFMAWVAAGKLVNTTLVALASYYAIDWLTRLFPD